MGNQLDYITWDEGFILGIQIIDRQHEKLIKMINNLHYILFDKNGSRNSHSGKIANETANYLQYHLNTEERIMLLLDYDEYNMHKEKHGVFMEEVATILKSGKVRDEKDLFELTNFLKSNGLHHMAIHDKTFAEFYFRLRESGCLRKSFILDSARSPLLA